MNSKLKYLLCLATIFYCHSISNAQVNKLDSLFSVLNNAKDTQRVNVLNVLAKEYQDSDVDLSFQYSQEALALAVKFNFKSGIAKSSNLLGSIYESQSKPNEALIYFFKYLKTEEDLKDKLGMAKASVNVGIVYAEKGMSSMALDYMNKALVLYQEIENKNGVADVLLNIGGVYDIEFNKSKALEFYTKSLNINTEVGNSKSISKCLSNIGYVYYKEQDYINAKKYLLNSNLIASEIKNIRVLRENYEMLTEIYRSEKQFEKALENQTLFSKMKDSLVKDKNVKQLHQLEAIYEATKKQKKIELLSKEKESQSLLAKEESKRKNFIIISVVVGFLLVIVFCVLLFNRFRIIKHQKIIIEEKNKDITDSIKYAKRIQTSLLPTEKYIDKSINRLKKD